MISKKIFTLSMVVTLGLAVAAQAAVIGSWTNTGNNYKFNVNSGDGMITSLELSFAAAASSGFQINFDENIFDSDGLIGGQPDSFLLFPASVTSPGATQAKTAALLQASFTGFTPFAAKDVAQLIVTGTPGTPLASNLARDPLRLGTAVVEVVPGDPNSRVEFPITLGGDPGDLVDPVIAPLVRNITLGVNHGDLASLQLTASDNVTPAGSLVWSALTPAGTNPTVNPGFPGSDTPDLSGSGVFSWNPNGWKQGTYLFNATVADAAGNDVSGLALTVNLTVPEPATLSLFGLALVGFVGFARRRS